MLNVPQHMWFWSSNEGSVESAQMRRLARAFFAIKNQTIHSIPKT